jgi:chromosome segregation ATPase
MDVIAERNKFRDKNKKLRAENHKLKEVCGEANKAIEKLREDNKTYEALMNSAEGDALKQVQELKAECEGLKEVIESQNEYINRVNDGAATDELRTQINDIMETSTQQRIEIERKDNEIVDLQERLNVSEARLKAAKEYLEEETEKKQQLAQSKQQLLEAFRGSLLAIVSHASAQHDALSTWK